MRADRILLLVLAAMLLVFLFLPTLADGSVKITTVVPTEHTVTVNCSSGGKITVSGTDYTGEHTFTVPRHDSFTLTAEADEGYVLDSITGNSTNGMTIGTNRMTLTSVCGNVRITVPFLTIAQAQAKEEQKPIIVQTPAQTPGTAPVQTPGTAPAQTPTTTPDQAPISTPVQAPKSTADQVTSSTPAQAPATTPVPDPISVTIPITAENENITAQAVIVGVTAEISVDETELDGLLASDTGARSVMIDVSAINTDVNTVVIPVHTVQTVAKLAMSSDSDLTGMDVVMPNTTVTFDGAALTAIADQAPEDTVTLHVEKVSADNLSLTQQAAVSDSPHGTVVVEVTLRSGSTVISDFKGGSAEVKLPYTPKEDEDTDTITVWFVAQEGTLENIPCRYEDGYVIFTLWHFSNYLVKPGTINAGTQVSQGSIVTDDHAPVEVRNAESEHCFICGWFSKNIDPWCWLTPLLVLFVLAEGCWFVFIKLRKNDKPF